MDLGSYTVLVEAFLTSRWNCRPFDYSVKVKRDADSHVCPAVARNLFARDGEEDDYSCSESKPCKNGACCSKETGYCNYGPEACGTGGKSPNDKCWSNCDAHAECGRFAKEPDKKCPLNVCCSQFGFCGMTEEFCKKGKGMLVLRPLHFQRFLQHSNPRCVAKRSFPR